MALNHLAEWLRDRWRTTKLAERDATLLAARVAVVLEKFAIECQNRISDSDLYQKSSGTFGSPHCALPVLEEYPSEAEADWKALEPALSIRVQSFRNEILRASKVIDFALDGDPDPSSWAQIDPQIEECGHRAWQFAADLRRRYKLSGFEPVGSVGVLKVSS
jgi:hypothetical protein